MATDLKTAVAQVKSAYLISDYIRASGVKLTSSGAGKWKGLCSFHSEKTPSFTVNDYFSNFHCFGCGESGDIIRYVMETQHIDFMDALRQLADEKGIKLDLGKNEDSGVDYKSLRECLRETANFFVAEYRKLPKDHRARAQVLERGLSERGMIYGYAPEKRTSLLEFLRSKGFSEEIMLQAGVVSQWKESGKFSDFWTGRLMFIITDIAGRPIGFSGRKLFDEDSRGKFVNSSAGPLFDKSSALFNVQNAKKFAAERKEVFVAEGQFDVAAFIEAGVPNVVASSGTAFTSQQGGILQRLVGDTGKIVFAFDGDNAGVEAALKVFKNVPSIHSASWVLQFPENQDPCDFRSSRGNEAFVQHLSEKIPLVEFVLDVSKKDYEMETELGRAKYLEYAARVLKTVASNTVREAFIRKVALDCFSEVGYVKDLVAKSSPIELGESSSTKETEKLDIPLQLEDSKDVLEKIRERKDYNLAARLIAISLLDPQLIAYLFKLSKKIPAEFTKTIEELSVLEPGKAIVPEAFSDTRLMQYLSNPRLFPLSHLAEFHATEQFKYLYEQYIATVKGKKKSDVRAKVLSVLMDSEGKDQIELLEKALKIEEAASEKRTAS